MTQRAKTETKPLSSLEGDILDHGQITDEDRLYERTIRTIHVLCTSQFPLRSLPTLLSLQFENGLEVSFDHISVGAPGEGGLTDWLQAGANIFLRNERDKASSTVMSVLFPQGVPFGAMGDGSNDRSQREQEAIVHRFLGPDGRPYNTFADLAELDLTKSVDGHSPDAQCITACYSNSFSRYNLHEGFVHMSDWAKALVAGSFDGASVMLGSQNGVVAKLAVEAPQTIWIHAAAHVTQLALGEAVGHTTRPPTRSEARTEGLRSGGPRAACRLGWKSTRGPPEAARGHSPSLGLASGAVASQPRPPRGSDRARL